MEFNEKLQQLRNSRHLTQEQLAEKLYVSRTTISKWESGRGYPTIDSLKEISKFFSVSIDELLSGDELITLAEDDRKNSESRLSNTVYAILDIMAALFIVLPLYGQQSNGMILSVSLLSYHQISSGLKGFYYVSLIGMTLLGIVELLLGAMEKEALMRKTSILSLIVHSLMVLLFMMSRQPYVSAFLFCFLFVKVVLLLTQRRKS